MIGQEDTKAMIDKEQLKWTNQYHFSGDHIWRTGLRTNPPAMEDVLMVVLRAADMEAV